MIQAIHKGVEIELVVHELPHDLWRCDYTLTTHPDRKTTFHKGDKDFSTQDEAKEYALQQAKAEIDKETAGKPVHEIKDPPRQVKI
jgi:hypothetical protein